MEKITNLYTTIKQLCDENNITIAQLERNLSFSEGLVSKWRYGNPSCDKITAVAKYFNVSLDFISGRTSIRQMGEHILRDEYIMSIQLAIERMSDDERNKMMMLLKLSFHDKF